MPLEFIQTEEDIRQKLKMARPLSHEAIHTFEHLKLEVYKELSQHEHVTGIKVCLKEIFHQHYQTILCFG